MFLFFVFRLCPVLFGFTATEGLSSVFCPADYTLYKGICFHKKDTPLNFNDAERECNKLPRGHLAAFRDDDEFQFLTQLKPE